MKKISAQLRAKSDDDRRKAEHARAQRTREAAAQERAMLATMRSDIRELKQTVERLTQQASDKKGKK